MTACKICHTDDQHQMYKVREMQFGTREEFVYFECSNCGCLQLRDIPKNLSDYYPEGYYSFRPNESSGSTLKQRVKKYGRRKIVDYQKTDHSILGKLLEKRYGHEFVPHWLAQEKLNISHKAKILDVGCGNGDRLLHLECLGFKNLLGVDPFISADITYPNRVKILKLSLDSLEGIFDFIMLHHSFEHLKEQLPVLKKLNSLLPLSGHVLIRIPIRAYAWQHYGVNWAQIDAPRHLFLHSPESISLLASQAGFEVEDVVYDSDEFQFWGSEQYARDIPLTADNSYGVDPSRSIFSNADIESYKQKARLLNQEKRGDQACFYFQKKL